MSQPLFGKKHILRNLCCTRGSARWPQPLSAATLLLTGNRMNHQSISYMAASASFLSGKQKLRRTQPFIHNKKYMFSWFSVIFFVTINLVMLHSFLFIHSREHSPRSLGCRQCLSWTVISIHQCLFVPQPLHKCDNCNTHKTTYQPFWAWNNPHGTGQPSLQDGRHHRRDEITKLFLNTRAFLLHSFDSWAIWHILNKPQLAHLFRTEEITLLQGTINYAVISEIMK